MPAFARSLCDIVLYQNQCLCFAYLPRRRYSNTQIFGLITFKIGFVSSQHKYAKKYALCLRVPFLMRDVCWHHSCRWIFFASMAFALSVIALSVRFLALCRSHCPRALRGTQFILSSFTFNFVEGKKVHASSSEQFCASCRPLGRVHPCNWLSISTMKQHILSCLSWSWSLGCVWLCSCP